MKKTKYYLAVIIFIMSIALVFSNNIFLYSDSSFEAMSYYYPGNSHMCFCYEPWYKVWQKVRFVDKKDFTEKKDGFKQWYVVNRKSKIPDWIKTKCDLVLKYSFRNDFNDVDVYLTVCRE